MNHKPPPDAHQPPGRTESGILSVVASVSTLLVVMALLLAPIACVAHSTKPDLSAVTCPVLVGPVLRIGGTPGKCPVGDVGQAVTGGSTFAEVITSQGSGQTQRTQTKSGRSDNVSSVFNKSVEGFDRPMLHVRTMKIDAMLHISLAGVLKANVQLTADPWDLAQEPWP